jgi:hypothetical protein
MADAAEVLGALYDAFLVVTRAQQVVKTRDDDTRIGRMFSLRVSEALHCSKCRVVSHTLTYSTFFHLAAVPALRAAAPDHAAGATAFESRLARLLLQDR